MGCRDEVTPGSYCRCGKFWTNAAANLDWTHDRKCAPKPGVMRLSPHELRVQTVALPSVPTSWPKLREQGYQLRCSVCLWWYASTSEETKIDWIWEQHQREAIAVERYGRSR